MVSEEEFALLPADGAATTFSLRDIKDVVEDDYKVVLPLYSGDTMVLFHLGYRFEDFLRTIRRFHNELKLKDMLMEETLIQAGLEALVVTSHVPAEGYESEVRLYQTALVFLPQRGCPVRIPYGDIDTVQEADWALEITTELGDVFRFTQMGSHLDLLKRTLAGCMNDLTGRAQALCRELVPSLGPSGVHVAARLMKEGRAARRCDLEAVSPELWEELENRLDQAGAGEEYRFLRDLSRSDRLSIGFKRALISGLEEDYLWFLAPTCARSGDSIADAIAMEATATASGGRATYLFRTQRGGEDLDKSLRLINRCMLDINFRREPIYLPETSLQKPQYARYRSSVELLPSLRILREAFIGRVPHVSQEQWKRGVLQLLAQEVGR